MAEYVPLHSRLNKSFSLETPNIYFDTIYVSEKLGQGGEGGIDI